MIFLLQFTDDSRGEISNSTPESKMHHKLGKIIFPLIFSYYYKVSVSKYNLLFSQVGEIFGLIVR